jgi:antitoxin HicB
MKNEQTIREYAMQVKPLTDEDGGGFEALFPQLARSIVGYGETQQEAVDDLLSAVPAFLQVMEESKQHLPAPEGPREWDEFSGKFNVRVPKMLHAKLVRLADEQGVSLNSLVQTILMSGATALEAGHEFGAIVEREFELMTLPRYNWPTKSTKGTAALRLEDYSALPKERNPDDWKMAVGN